MGAVAEPVTRPQEQPERDDEMIHLTRECCEPYTRTMCGFGVGPLNEGIYEPGETMVDCVVCYEMVRRRPVCPNCGRRA